MTGNFVASASGGYYTPSCLPNEEVEFKRVDPLPVFDEKEVAKMSEPKGTVENFGNTPEIKEKMDIEKDILESQIPDLENVKKKNEETKAKAAAQVKQDKVEGKTDKPKE
mgnify:CR=1 FL=1